MTVADRQATIYQAFDLRGAELRCQTAEAQALPTFLAAPDKAAHWNGMSQESKELMIEQRLQGLDLSATADDIAHWLAKYDARYAR